MRTPTRTRPNRPSRRTRQEEFPSRTGRTAGCTSCRWIRWGRTVSYEPGEMKKPRRSDPPGLWMPRELLLARVVDLHLHLLAVRARHEEGELARVLPRDLVNELDLEHLAVRGIGAFHREGEHLARGVRRALEGPDGRAHVVHPAAGELLLVHVVAHHRVGLELHPAHLAADLRDQEQAADSELADLGARRLHHRRFGRHLELALRIPRPLELLEELVELARLRRPVLFLPDRGHGQARRRHHESRHRQAHFHHSSLVSIDLKGTPLTRPPGGCQWGTGRGTLGAKGRHRT